MIDYKTSVTLNKYKNFASIYRKKRGIRFYNGFSQASRKRLVKLACGLGYHSDKEDSDFYFFATTTRRMK